MCSRTALLVLLSLFGCARGVAIGADGRPITIGEAGAITDAEIKDASSEAGRPDSDAMSSAKDAEPPPLCEATNTCSAATVIPTISGDQGADRRMLSGAKSEWLSVKVTDATLVGTSLSVGLTLTSEGGANYDLFVLQPDERGGHQMAPKDCAANPVNSQNASGADMVKLSWDDVTNAIGETDGDGLVIAIEVRHVSGPCGSWALTVDGAID